MEERYIQQEVRIRILEDIATKIDKRFDLIDKQFDKVDRKFEKVNHDVFNLSESLNKIYTALKMIRSVIVIVAISVLLHYFRLM